MWWTSVREGRSAQEKSAVQNKVDVIVKVIVTMYNFYV